MKKMKKILLTLALISTAALADGASLYAKCVGCHGANGEKSALGKTAAITGQETQKTVKQLTAYQEGSLSMYGMGSLMKGQVTSFSKEDIFAVSEYIKNMK